MTLDIVEIIIGKSRPLLLELAFDDVPVAIDSSALIAINDPSPSTVAPWGVILLLLHEPTDGVAVSGASSHGQLPPRSRGVAITRRPTCNRCLVR